MKLRKIILASGIGAALMMGLDGCGQGASEATETAVAETGEIAAGTEDSSGESADDGTGKYDEIIDLHFVRSTDETVDKVLEARPEETLEDN